MERKKTRNKPKKKKEKKVKKDFVSEQEKIKRGEYKICIKNIIKILILTHVLKNIFPTPPGLILRPFQSKLLY